MFLNRNDIKSVIGVDQDLNFQGCNADVQNDFIFGGDGNLYLIGSNAPLCKLHFISS